MMICDAPTSRVAECSVRVFAVGYTFIVSSSAATLQYRSPHIKTVNNYYKLYRSCHQPRTLSCWRSSPCPPTNVCPPTAVAPTMARPNNAVAGPSPCPLLVALLFSSAFAPSTAAAATAATTAPVTVAARYPPAPVGRPWPLEVRAAVILPADNRFIITLSKVMPVLDIAVRDLYATGVLSETDVTFKFLEKDDKCEDIEAILSSFDLVMNGGVDLFLGPTCDYGVGEYEHNINILILLLLNDILYTIVKIITDDRGWAMDIRWIVSQYLLSVSCIYVDNLSIRC